MDEENKEEIIEQASAGAQEATKVETKKGFDIKNIDKKWFIYGGIGLAVLILLIIIIVVAAGRSSGKGGVKSFVSAMNSRNAKKVVNSMDFAGMEAWSQGYYFEGDNFKTKDYKEFIEDYKDVDKNDVKELKEEAIEDLNDTFEDIKDEYKSYKFKIKRIRKPKKLGNNLYQVKANIQLTAKPKDKDDDEIDSSKTVTFIVYKNKVIYTSMGII